jgi:hypothetical protein
LIRYPHLLESPLAAIRRRHGLDPATAAERLHIPVLRLARLEQATRRFPARELAAYRRLLEPEPRLVQAVLFEPILDLNGNYVGEGEAGFSGVQTGLPKNF